MFYEPKKSYLDLFLDNHVTPKKRERYFEEREEHAIIKYNDEATEQLEKNDLFKRIIGPAFRKTIYGVLEMPKFRHLPKSLNRETLIEDTFFRLVEKIYKFKPGMIGKSGQPVKAFSYFSTIAKNFILEQITRHNKIIKNKADVESSIDLSILSEETLDKISGVDIQEVTLDDYVTIFTGTRRMIIDIIRELIIEEEDKERRDEDFIKLGYCLKYLLEKWNKIEFMKKNEFMRILTLYTGFQQQKVSFLFKRFKTAVLKKLKPSALNKSKRKKSEESEDDDIFLRTDFFNSSETDEFSTEEEIEEFDDSTEEVVEEDEETKIMKYEVYSMDDFEARDCKLDNAKFKKEWRKTRDIQV
jgi:hypothetical protein